MSMRSKVKVCHKCKNMYFMNPGDPIKGCPYCREKNMRRMEYVISIFHRLLGKRQ